MNDWPDGWTEGNRPRGNHGGGYHAEPTRTMPNVPPQSRGGYDDRGDGYSDGRVYGGGGGDQYGGPDTGYRPRPNWRKRITVGLVTLIAVLLIVSISTYFWADSKLRKEVDLSKVEDRPDGGSGTNYLIVGSDSREGMTKDDKKRLHTGSAEGKRTDSMMILHVGDNGTTMVSLPRDWYVTIPPFKGSESGKQYGSQKTKINAAYAQDGATLLVRTVEYNTGLKIDHYAEIGFGGFANIVDELGGVEMCFDKAVKDKNSGADFAKGCQDLNGEQALAFVRNRYNVDGGDLGRTQNQQKLLAALASEAATPTTVINPFKLYPTMGAGLDALIVDTDASPFTVLEMFWAMKGVNGGDGKRLNLPTVSGGNVPGVGSVLKWDAPKAKKLLEQLKNDEPVTVTN
ncbi:Transcriptional regulator LytR [Streptomyces sp. RB5]|uniref:Transcriptional regulator LytR n=1 Tax=Streptomyces smaragdinus TaxID=2585196 RepID=A0A7K0CRV0_9ACTN|nr:LCP family protein [Streptomyces smaragdinus]MQY16073.1 Transcriptional regulator LytR [Streptomyces smaragdinus]